MFVIYRVLTVYFITHDQYRAYSAPLLFRSGMKMTRHSTMRSHTPHYFVFVKDAAVHTTTFPRMGLNSTRITTSQTSLHRDMQPSELLIR